MSKVILVSRILLGFIFFFFGMNGILQFMKAPLPAGDAGTYLGILFTHKVVTFVSLCEIVAGLLLMVGRFVPLALTILGPIIVNILLYHILILTPFSLAAMIPALIVTILEIVLIFQYRLSFRGLFDANPEKI